MSDKYSITLQVNVAKRVLAVFHGLYPDMIEKQLIDYDTASVDTKGLTAIVRTLEWFEKHEEIIKSEVAKELARRDKTRVANDARPISNAAPATPSQDGAQGQAMDGGGSSA